MSEMDDWMDTPGERIVHDGDDVTIEFLDDDGEVVDAYEMAEDVFEDEFAARVDAELDLDMIVGPESMLMFIERDVVRAIFDEMDDVEQVQ